MGARVVVPLVVVVAAGSVGGALLLRTPAAAPPAPRAPATATVARRDLVATDTESGTIGFAGSATVYDWLSGAITWLPNAGQVIKPGGTLFDVANEPVVLLSGSVPAYRALASTDSDGPDVLELNRSLAQLGYDPYGAIVADDAWQAATTTAVQRWQVALGEPATGVIPFGRVAFLTGARYVTAVETSLGSAGQSTAGAAYLGGAHAELIAAPSAGVAALAQQVAQLRQELAGGGSTNAQPQPVLQTASTRVVVDVSLSANLASEAVLGGSVSVQLPDGDEVGGNVTAVGAPTQAPASSAPTVAVTIALSGPVGRLRPATVSVQFVQQSAAHVLSVPVTALLATRGGGYALQPAVAPRTLLPVTTGVFGAGYVQISGAGVYAGLRVTDSEG